MRKAGIGLTLALAFGIGAEALAQTPRQTAWRGVRMAVPAVIACSAENAKVCILVRCARDDRVKIVARGFADGAKRREVGFQVDARAAAYFNASRINAGVYVADQGTAKGVRLLNAMKAGSALQLLVDGQAFQVTLKGSRAMIENVQSRCGPSEPVEAEAPAKEVETAVLAPPEKPAVPEKEPEPEPEPELPPKDVSQADPDDTAAPKNEDPSPADHVSVAIKDVEPATPDPQPAEDEDIAATGPSAEPEEVVEAPADPPEDPLTLAETQPLEDDADETAAEDGSPGSDASGGVLAALMQAMAQAAAETAEEDAAAAPAATDAAPIRAGALDLHGVAFGASMDDARDALIADAGWEVDAERLADGWRLNRTNGAPGDRALILVKDGGADAFLWNSGHDAGETAETARAALIDRFGPPHVHFDNAGTSIYTWYEDAATAGAMAGLDYDPPCPGALSRLDRGDHIGVGHIDAPCGRALVAAVTPAGVRALLVDTDRIAGD